MSTNQLITAVLLYALAATVLPLLCIMASELMKRKIRYTACYAVLIVCALRIIVPTGVTGFSLFSLPSSIGEPSGIYEGYVESSPTDGDIENHVLSGNATQKDEAITDNGGAYNDGNNIINDTRENTQKELRLGLLIRENALNILLALWGVGFIVCILRTAILHIGTARQEDLVKLEAPSEITALYKSMCIEMGIKRAPALYMIDTNAPPHLCGVIKPRIYIGNMPLEEREARYILAHELTHYLRGDILSKGLLSFTLSLFWWNPVVWLFVKYTHKVIEISCDESVLFSLEAEDRCEYGGTVLRVLKESRRAKSSVGVGLSFGKHASLERFREIVGFSRKKKGSVAICVISALLVFSIFLFGCSERPSEETVKITPPTESEVTDKFFIKGECKLTEEQLMQIASTLTVPEREGMRMIGWNVFSDKRENGDYSLNIEAAFEPISYEITLVSNGGDMGLKKALYEYASALPAPERSGYTFGGWYEDIELTRKLESVPSRSVTLYAKWLEENSPTEFGFVDKGSYLVISEYLGESKSVVAPAYVGGKPVGAVDVNCFAFNTTIESITLPYTVTRIGVGAFRYCYNLQSILIGGNIDHLDRSVFDACYALKDIYVYGEISNIGEISKVTDAEIHTLSTKK